MRRMILLIMPMLFLMISNVYAEFKISSNRETSDMLRHNDNDAEILQPSQVWTKYSQKPVNTTGNQLFTAQGQLQATQKNHDDNLDHKHSSHEDLGDHGHDHWRNRHYNDSAIYFVNEATPSMYAAYSASVNPPIGFILPSLPQNHQTFQVNGQVYYESNGAYYVDNPQGYKVISQPVPNYEEVTPNNGSAISFTVNIPNNRNGYTPVIIKKVNNGFLGPQGEFYPQFPTVEQLKNMYGQ